MVRLAGTFRSADDDLGRERVGASLVRREQQAENARPPTGEPARHGVGCEVELAHRIEDALACRLGDRARPAERVRHGAQRDPGPLGHIRHRCHRRPRLTSRRCYGRAGIERRPGEPLRVRVGREAEIGDRPFDTLACRTTHIAGAVHHARDRHDRDAGARRNLSHRRLCHPTPLASVGYRSASTRLASVAHHRGTRPTSAQVLVPRTCLEQRGPAVISGDQRRSVAGAFALVTEARRHYTGTIRLRSSSFPS